MDAFIDISLPVFGIMLVGYLAGKTGLVQHLGASSLNGYVYYVALPALFAKATATSPLAELFKYDYLMVVAGGYVFTAIIAWVLGRIFFVKRIGEVALHVGNGIFANTGYMGIPLILIAYGERATPFAISGVLFNAIGVFAVILAILEYDKAKLQEPDLWKIVKTVAKAIIKNPLVLSAAFGLMLAGFQVNLPIAGLRFLDLLGQSAGPCALFAMGLFISNQKFKGNLLEITWVSGFKLLIHPLITWLLARYVFKLDLFEEAIAVTLAALPTGALMFLLADIYDLYRQRGAAVIVLSTLLAVISVSLVLTYYH